MTVQPVAGVPRPRRSLVAGSVSVFERVVPDPFVLAIGLTVLVALAALLVAPKGDPATILSSWYAGVFGILAFAFQMILILVTGHALAHTPAVQGGLRAIVSRITSPNMAVVVTMRMVGMTVMTVSMVGVDVVAMSVVGVAGMVSIVVATEFVLVSYRLDQGHRGLTEPPAQRIREELTEHHKQLPAQTS